jgi:HK97 gp10 family phage protein
MMGFSTQEYINRVGRRPGAPQPVSLAIGRASVGTGSSAVKVEGLEHFKAQLANLTAQMRRRVLGNALRAGAREIRDTAKRNAPVLCGRNLSAPYRKPGTVRDAISVRTSKTARKAGDVGVFVNVKPLPGNKYKAVTKENFFRGKVRGYTLVKKTERGAHNPNDPYYWRFLEFGTRKMAERSFLRKATDRLPQALAIFEDTLAKWINKVDKTGNTNAV